MSRSEIQQELARQFELAWNQGSRAVTSAMRMVFLVARLVLVSVSDGLAVADEKWLQDEKEMA